MKNEKTFSMSKVRLHLGPSGLLEQLDFLIWWEIRNEIKKVLSFLDYILPDPREIPLASHLRHICCQKFIDIVQNVGPPRRQAVWDV